MPTTVAKLPVPSRPVDACACGGGCPRCREHGPPQKTFVINAPEDRHEREADHVASEVARMPLQQNHHRPSGGAAMANVRPSASLGSLQSFSHDTRWVAQALPLVEEVLSSPGHGMDGETRAFFESRLAHDFSATRVHADSRAAESARAIQADAYTVGQHVVFGANRYRPATDAGRRLVAHELAHVVQQDSPVTRQGVHVLQRAGGGGAGTTGGTPAAAPAPAVAPAPAAAGASSLICPRYFDKLGPAVRVGPTLLRLADCGCVWKGGSPAQPTSTALTTPQIQQLQALIDQLRRDLPDLYAEIQDKDVQVSHAVLTTGTMGQMAGQFEECATEKTEWVKFDTAGGDFPRGILPSQAEYDQAVMNLANMDPSPIAGVTGRESRYRYVGSILIDLNQAGSTTQSAFATLRHEAGHLLFESKSRTDRAASPALSADLQAKATTHFGHAVAKEIDLLTEFAAEGLEKLPVGVTFNLALFTGEFDPAFGISGFRDVDANPVTPQIWGARSKATYSLLDARKKAHELSALGITPIALQTLISLDDERRDFHLWLGEFPTREDGKAWIGSTFEPLGMDIVGDVELAKY